MAGQGCLWLLSFLLFSEAWKFKIDYNHQILRAIGDQCNVTAYIDQVAKTVVSQLVDSPNEKLKESDLEDIYYLHVVMLNQTSNTFQPLSERNQEHAMFMMVKPEFIEDNKFLPFDMEDIDSFFNLDLLDKILTYMSRHRDGVQIPLVIPEDCYRGNHTYREVYMTEDTHLRPQVRDSIVEVLAALSQLLRLRMIHDYQVCHVTWTQMLDAPLRLDQCCSAKFHSIKSPIRTTCHKPDRIRQILSHIIATVGFLLASFVPLMIKCVPSNTRRSKKRRPTIIPEANGRLRKGLTDDQTLSTTPIKFAAETPAANENEEGVFSAIVEAEDPATKHQLMYDREQSETYDGVQEWVIIDGDPVFGLSISKCVSNALCLRSNTRAIILLIRFCFFFALFSLTGLMVSWIYLYYKSFFAYSFPMLQSILLKGAFDRYKGASSYEMDHREMFLAFSVYVPLGLTTMVMLMLFPVTLLPRQFAKALHWTHQCRLAGHNIECSIKEKHLSSRFKHKIIGYPERLYNNMVHNILHLKEKQFWKVVWNKIICRFAPCCGHSYHINPQRNRLQCSVLSKTFQCLSIIVTSPIAVVLIILHVLPVCSVLTKIFMHPKLVLIPTACRTRSCWSTLAVILVMPFFVCGLALFYICMYNFVITVAYMVVFLSINMIRRGEDSLSWIVFTVSIVVYVKDAVAGFNDGYLDFKLKIIRAAEKIEAVDIHEGSKHVLRSDSQTPMLKSYGKHNREKAIPKVLFIDVCDDVKPYGQNLARTILKILFSVALISFLLFVIVHFKVFEDFSEIGQTIMTILTVSVPMALGKFKSTVLEEVGYLREDQFIEDSIMDNTLVTTNF